MSRAAGPGLASRRRCAIHGTGPALHRRVLVLEAHMKTLTSVLGLLASGHERGLSEEEEVSIAETIAGLPEQYPDVEFREVHRTADPAEALIDASESAKLVVVGGRKHGAARAFLLRSVSTALVEMRTTSIV